MKLSVAAQLVVPFIVICSAIICLLGIGAFSAVSSILYDSLDEKSRCVVRTTASELRGPLLLGEDLHVRAILSTAMKSDRDFSYAIVGNDGGEVMDSVCAASVKPPAFDTRAVKLMSGTLDVHRLAAPGSRGFEMVAPIEVSGERAGILRMGFTTEHIERQIKVTEMWILAIGLLALALGSLAYMALISRAILRPIKAMVAMSARVACGDVGETVEVKRRDEIGELATAMNQMVGYLREMTTTADAIANGNLTVNLQPRSDQDGFGTAFKKMVESLNHYTTELVSREEEAKKLAAIVQYSHDAIISVDVTGKVISWNNGAESLLGYRAQDIIDQSIDVLLPDEERRHQFYSLFDSNREHIPFSTLETDIVRMDGKRVEVSITLSPVVSETAATTSYSLIARDVTHKRLIERRLREFYSMISHELRTPLTSIRGGLTLISEGVVPADSENGRKLITLAKSSCMRLIRLINHILDMRKIEDGKIEFDLQSISCDELIARSKEEMEAFAHERDVKLTIAPGISEAILVDADRMVQVLTNLISNAVKYSEPGQEVVIAVEAVDGDCLRFTVKDSGLGISAENQSKLFQQFQQVDSSDSRAKEGSGLGLFISKVIVEQHGGRIGVSSTVGAGSAFWFEIPLKAAGDVETRAEQAAAQHAGACDVPY